MNNTIKYKINWEKTDGVFAVPNETADCLKLASGAGVKILLLMLRYGKECTYDTIKSALGSDDETIEDALSYWAQVGILKPADGVPQKLPEPAPRHISAPAPRPAEDKPKVSPTRTMTPKEIAERIESSPEIAFLFTSVENCLGRILNHTEHRSLIWIHDYLGLPSDVLLMLIEYCKSINKTNIRYIETIAVSWQEKGVFTHEAAAAEIDGMVKSHTLSRQVSTKLGLNRNLISKEQNFVDEWSSRGITIEMIYYAYEKNIEAIGKLSFAYMNKIIQSWIENGLRSVKEVEEFDSMQRAEREKQKNSTKQEDKGEHSYDLDMFDTFALNHTPELKEADRK